MKHYSILAFRSNKDYENEKYKLYLERVRLKQQNTLVDETPPQPPEKSHDSSALYLGFGQYDKTSFSSLKFRNALHDVEQPDFGTVAFSQNEMLSLEVRYAQPDENANTPSSLKNFQIHRLTYLNLMNLDPVNQLNQNLSWKIQASTLNEWKYDLDVSIGYSFDFAFLSRTRVAYFLSTRAAVDPDEENSLSYLNGLGPRLFAIGYIGERFGISADLAYYWNDHNKPFFHYKSKLNYNLKHNIDFQIQTENHFDQKTETQMQFVWNFIL